MPGELAVSRCRQRFHEPDVPGIMDMEGSGTMELAPYKIKLCRNKNTGDGSCQYSLTYKIGKGDISQAGYDILSALAGDSDLIIELNTDLFSGVSQDPWKCSEKLLSDIQTYNLVYNSRSGPSRALVHFFGMTVERRDKKQVQETAAYVPNSIWKNPSFRDFLPACGARYYITGEPMDARTAVDSLFTLPEEQKAVRFRMILFHMAQYARFGIVSEKVSEEELRGLLGLK